MSTKFVLTAHKETPEELLDNKSTHTEKTSTNEASELKSGTGDETDESDSTPLISIKLESYNIAEGYSSFSLNFEKSELKSIFNGFTTVRWETHSHYISVFMHRTADKIYDYDYGYYYSNHIEVQRKCKKPGLFSSFKNVGDKEDVFYGGYVENKQNPGEYDQVALKITYWEAYRDRFRIYHDMVDVRTNNCLMGEKDDDYMDECYVGSCPPGTTPFVWEGPTTGNLYFFYTAYPEGTDPCPREGTWLYKGNGSCYFAPIPVAVDHAYVRGSDFLVSTERMYPNQE